MINYSGLPQRVRRIVKQYEYCIESVQTINNVVSVNLKPGYWYKGAINHAIITANMEKLIEALKTVTKPASREIKVALYGFPCLICRCQVHKGSNYTDIGGLKTCTNCA